MNKHADKREVFHCDCGYMEHMFVVDHHYWGEGEADFSIIPMLSKKSFTKRVGIALRYLVGAQSRHGAFDTILLDDVDVRRLRKSCDDFLTKWEAGYDERMINRGYVWEEEEA